MKKKSAAKIPPSHSEVLAFEDSQGNLYLVPLDKLKGALVDPNRLPELRDAVTKGLRPEKKYVLVGVTALSDDLRRASYVTPTIRVVIEGAAMTS